MRENCKCGGIGRLFGSVMKGGFKVSCSKCGKETEEHKMQVYAELEWADMADE